MNILEKTGVGRNILLHSRRYVNGEAFENVLVWSGLNKEARMQAGDCFVMKPAGFRRMDRAIQGMLFILPFHCTKFV